MPGLSFAPKSRRRPQLPCAAGGAQCRAIRRPEMASAFLTNFPATWRSSMRALALRVSAGVVIACLFACGIQAASAQGRGQGKGPGGNQSAGGGNPGASRAGRGRSSNNGQSRSDNEGAGARPRESDDQGRDDSTGGDGGRGHGRGRGGDHSDAGDADAEDSNGSHGQEVSARRRAAIEAWKASGQSGPPPWAGVGGGPGGNPNHPGKHKRGKAKHGSDKGGGDEERSASAGGNA